MLICITNTVDCMGRAAIRLSENNWTGAKFKFQFPRRNRLRCFGSMDAFLAVYCFWKMVNKGVLCVWIDLLACVHSVCHISSLLHLLQAFIVVVAFSPVTIQYFFFCSATQNNQQNTVTYLQRVDKVESRSLQSSNYSRCPRSTASALQLILCSRKACFHKLHSSC